MALTEPNFVPELTQALKIERRCYRLRLASKCWRALAIVRVT